MHTVLKESRWIDVQFYSRGGQSPTSCSDCPGLFSQSLPVWRRHSSLSEAFLSFACECPSLLHPCKRDGHGLSGTHLQAEILCCFLPVELHGGEWPSNHWKSARLLFPRVKWVRLLVRHRPWRCFECHTMRDDHLVLRASHRQRAPWGVVQLGLCRRLAQMRFSRGARSGHVSSKLLARPRTCHSRRASSLEPQINDWSFWPHPFCRKDLHDLWGSSGDGLLWTLVTSAFSWTGLRYRFGHFGKPWSWPRRVGSAPWSRWLTQSCFGQSWLWMVNTFEIEV